MHFQKLAILPVLATLVASQEIENGDIPQQCIAVCSQVLTIARDCDAQKTNDDRAELECICRAPNSGTLIPTCEACVKQFDNDDDNDIRDVLRSCNFSTTTYNSAAASSALPPAPGGSVITTTSGTVVLTTSVPASNGLPAQQTQTGGAPVQTAAASAAVGIFGLAVGLL